MPDPVDRQHLDLVLTMEAAPQLSVPHLARRFVLSSASLFDARASETVLLLTSEVVTNAVKHARTDRVSISLERVGESLRIAVTDDDPEPPVLRARDDTRIGGLGVQMVDQMASAWGVDVGERGKHVWFEVDAN